MTTAEKMVYASTETSPAETGPTVEKDDARQGQRILGMPTVLGVSTIAAAVLLGIALIAWIA